jgi:hypothetical protein
LGVGDLRGSRRGVQHLSLHNLWQGGLAVTEPDRIWINEKWEAYLRPTFDGDTSGYVRADLARVPLAEALAVIDTLKAQFEAGGSPTAVKVLDLARERIALKPTPTVTAGWPTEEGEGSIIVGNVKGESHD